MPVHIHAAAAKGDALHFKQQPLLERVLAGHADRASSAQHAMPGQAVEGAESPNHLPRGAGKSSGGGDLSVGGHLATRDLSDRVRKND